MSLYVFSIVCSGTALCFILLLWRRVRKLEKLIEKSPKQPYTQEPTTFDTIELTLGAMLEELEAKNQEILSALDQRWQRYSREETNNHSQAPTPLAALTSHVNGPEVRDKAELVHQLAADGLDVLTIAQRLGLGKGEVQLILELKRQSS